MQKLTCPFCGEQIVTTSLAEPSQVHCPKCRKSMAFNAEDDLEKAPEGEKRCAYCGSCILIGSSTCAVCGFSQPEEDVPYVKAATTDVKDVPYAKATTPVVKEKKLSFGVGLLCLILPFLGVLLWLIDLGKNPRKAVNELLLSLFPTMIFIASAITASEQTPNGVTQNRRYNSTPVQTEIAASEQTPNGVTQNRQYNSTPVQTNTDAWYEGGTLHQANGLEWQQASYRNRLATCADIICMMWQEGHLRSDLAATIHDLDDIRPLADSLVTALNNAFEPYPDPEQNERVYANQTVADYAAMILAACGWWQ